MRILGVILIIGGILMLIFRGFNFTREKEVIDVGPIEVNKQEKKRITWPIYAGAIAIIGGLGLVVFDKKSKPV